MSLPAAIEFLSILAYPESAARRARAEEAMRAYYLRRCKEAGTLKVLGDVMPQQQMENQFHRLQDRLNKRLVAADDCVALESNLSYEGKSFPIPASERQELLREVAAENVPMKRLLLTTTEAGQRLSLNEVAKNRAAASPGHERYKTDFWCPPVMHLAIVLRGIGLNWKLSAVPFCPEALILTWAEWIGSALHNAPAIALELARHSNPALAGFRKTRFLFPDDP